MRRLCPQPYKSRPPLALILGAGLQLWACGDAPPPAMEPPPETALTTPVRRVRRLSSREYNNVVRDLLGDTSRPADHFVVDAYQNGYDNGSAGLAVQSDQVVDYQNAAEALAATAVQDQRARLIGTCDDVKQGAMACLEAFLSTFAPRAYRRPLTPEEAGRLRELFNAEQQAGSSFARSLQTVLEVMLQSPQFLYREELGPADVTAGAEVALTEYETASELSFLLTGTLPDDALWSAVTQGHFQTAQDYKLQASRLLQTPGARDALRAFLHKWLTTDRVLSLSKDASFYPTFSPALAASMSGELDRFYDDVLWNGQGTLRALLSSNQSFVDAPLGQLYGVPVTGSEFQRVTLDPMLRKGVLSRAGYLAVHAATDSSGPIARGVFVLQALLCLPPPQPPPNIPPAIPAGDPMAKNLTTRQRFDRHVADSFCKSCHSQIDGVGFGFEQFDGIGAYRTMENGQPVDSSGSIIGSGEIDGSYSGVAELSAKIAGSHLIADCFVKQAYRYALGQIEPDGENLHKLIANFTTDAQLTDALLAVVDSPLFVKRSFEPQDKGGGSKP